MTWIILALGGYALGAVTNILDKYLLSSRIPQPSVYAFFVSMLSMVSFALAPIGLSVIHPALFASALVSGALFTYGLLFFYKAVKVSDISRVAPLVGSLTTVSMLGIVLTVSDVTIELESMAAFWFLTVGGFFIAFDIPLKPRLMFRGMHSIIIASLLLGSSLLILKYIYAAEGFVNGYVWSRTGAFLAGLTMLFVPAWRREIWAALRKPSGSRLESAKTGAWFLVNKISGALSTLCINYAVFLGSLTIVYALSGMQYAFVLIIVGVLSRWQPRIVREHLSFQDWVQKGVALACIGIGLYYATISATMLL